MESGITLKEKHLIYNTLVSLIKSIQGQQTTVDLRNGASVTGKISNCDAYMNLDLSHVLFRDTSGRPHIFENFFVHSRNIRYVHIPPQVNMKKSVETFLERSRHKPNTQQSTFKGSRMMRQHAATLQRVRKLKEKKEAIKREHQDRQGDLN